MTKSKLVELALKITFLFVLILVSITLFFGISHLLSTLIIGLGFFYSLDLICKKYLTSFSNSNWRISFWAICFVLIIVEVALKLYSLQHTRESAIYTFPNKQRPIEYLLKKHVLKLEDISLMVNPPLITEFTGSGEFFYAHSYNSLGLRDVEHDTKEANTFTVLGLGDSYMEGVGAPQDSTWFSLMQEMASEDSLPLNFVNAGCSGSDLFFEYYKLKELLVEAYQPDLVILSINSTDILDVAKMGGKERFKYNTLLKDQLTPIWYPMYTISHVFRLFVKAVFHMDDVTWMLDDQKAQLIIADMESLIVNDFRELSKTKNFELMVVLCPTEIDFRKADFAYSRLDQALTANGIAVLNLYDDMNHGNLIISDYYWEIDGHCNSKGYGIWADVLYPKVVNYLNYHSKL